MRPDQAVILCGGRGERLRPLTDTMPKPMAPVNGRPFLTYLIEQVRDQGVRRIVLLTGYRGEMIHSHFGDGSALGVRISYSHGPAEWETGRRVWEARATLDARFLLLYSDNYMPVNLELLRAFHDERAAAITLMLARKDRGNVRVGADGVVEVYDPKRSESGMDLVEVGYMLAERDAVIPLIDPPDVSFSSVLRRLTTSRKLAGLISGDAYQSISDPERWRLAEDYLRGRRILLIDRDGTINERPARGAYVADWASFRWIGPSVEGMRALASDGFSFVVISNQAGIGRGMVSEAAVQVINRRMVAELAAMGVSVLDVLVCPHDWNAGCECRKPAPGLLQRASRHHRIRLDRTFFIGDDPRDAQAAYNAACPAILIGPERQLAKAPATPVFAGESLVEVVPGINAAFAAWDRFYVPVEMA